MMNSTLDNLMDRAKSVANSATKMTGEMVELSKNKLQAFKINSNIQRAYEKLGSIVYDSAKFGTDSELLVKACIEEIDGLLAELEEVNSRIEEGRPGGTCKTCGFTNPESACYCAKCGASLAHAPAPSAEEPGEDQEADGTDGADEGGEEL